MTYADEQAATIAAVPDQLDRMALTVFIFNISRANAPICSSLVGYPCTQPASLAAFIHWRSGITSYPHFCEKHAAPYQAFMARHNDSFAVGDAVYFPMDSSRTYRVLWLNRVTLEAQIRQDHTGAVSLAHLVHLAHVE